MAALNGFSEISRDVDDGNMAPSSAKRAFLSANRVYVDCARAPGPDCARGDEPANASGGRATSELDAPAPSQPETNA